MATLQVLMVQTLLVSSMSPFILTMAVLLKQVAAGANMAAVYTVFDTSATTLSMSLGMMGLLSATNSLLFDIPQQEEETTTKFSALKILCLDNISDAAAHNTTHFFHG
jgi:hypothetical protein